MIGRHYLLEIKRVKELALPTLLPPHHGSLPRFVVSFRRNHGSSPVSTRVLQHIRARSRLQPNCLFRSAINSCHPIQRPAQRRAFSTRRGDEPVHSMDEAVSLTFAPRPRLGSPSSGN